MSAFRCSISWAACAACLAVSAAPAQRPTATTVPLSAVLTAFLVDSGVRAQGLPWTTGSALPIHWAGHQRCGPDQGGVTQQHPGRLLGTLGDSVATTAAQVGWCASLTHHATSDGHSGF
jgi:hypothetical protein